MLLGTLSASLLGNSLAGKEIIRAGEGVIAKSVSKERKSKKQGLGIVRAGYEKKGQKATTKGHKNKVNFSCRVIL